MKPTELMKIRENHTEEEFDRIIKSPKLLHYELIKLEARESYKEKVNQLNELKSEAFELHQALGEKLSAAQTVSEISQIMNEFHDQRNNIINKMTEAVATTEEEE